MGDRNKREVSDGPAATEAAGARLAAELRPGDVVLVAGEDPALLDDYLTPDRIGFVEWPGEGGSRVERVTARVRIEHLGGDRRAITIDR